MPPFAKVTCQVKVLEVGKIQTSEGAKIQNITISDGTTARITLMMQNISNIRWLTHGEHICTV